jgi:hypothetical protein
VPLGYTLSVGCSGAGLFLGEVEVGLWRGLCEVEDEGQATAAWVDRLRSHAGEPGLVFLVWACRGGGLGASGAGR